MPFADIRLDLTAHFAGDGYLELNHTAVTSKTQQNATTLAVLFSTTEPNGLILWYGQPKGEILSDQDFIALAIVDGFLEFVFRVDGEEYTIRQPSQRVDKGIRHIAVIKRNRFGGFIELDHVSETKSMKPTGRKEIYLPGNIFLGGAPDLPIFTGNRYFHGFKGCIHTVEGETDGGIILGRYAVSAVNVNSCPNANWISSLVYTDIDTDFGNRFDPSSFDEIGEPPPVHILYPRPTFWTYRNSINRIQLNIEPLLGFVLFIYMIRVMR